MSIFNSKESIQRLNLETPSPDLSREQPLVSGGPSAAVEPNPEKVAEVQRRIQEILKSGQTPDGVFVCRADSGPLTFQYAADKKAVLLFTDPFAAQDYMRATSVVARIGQIKLESLPEVARSWAAAGERLSR